MASGSGECQEEWRFRPRVRRLLPAADAATRHAALALAAQLGHPNVVALLLDARGRRHGARRWSVSWWSAGRFDLRDTVFGGTPPELGE